MASISRGIKYLFHNPSHFVDSILTNYLTFLPDKLYLSLRYRCRMGHWINWKNPKTFTEKIQWLKLNNRKPEYTQMVDKYAVKDYVAGIIGEEYIIPTLGVWDKPEDIDWDSLPEQFVLKTTHGGGGGGVVICTDKNTFDREQAVAKLSQSLNSDIYKTFREWPYKNVPRRIIAEQFINHENNSIRTTYLADYKFFCFDGIPKFLYVSDSQAHRMSFLNTDWTFAGFGRDDYKELTDLPPKPDNFDEMLAIARQLSAGKPHVRVDLYDVDKHIYFGELTFFTGSGFIPINPILYDSKLGDLLALPNTTDGDI